MNCRALNQYVKCAKLQDRTICRYLNERVYNTIHVNEKSYQTKYQSKDTTLNHDISFD